MKTLVALFTLVSLFSSAAAQTAVAPADPAAERTRIATERSMLEAGFLTEDAACYKRFFVNNCLDGVNSRRREALAGLRKQEISLNEQERKLRGAEQIRQIEEKASAESQQQEADRRAKAAVDFQSRQVEQTQNREQKQKAGIKAQAAGQANGEARAARLKANAQKQQARREQQAAEAAETARYDARQKQADERRALNAKEQLQRAKSGAKPLPLPH